MDNQPRSDVRIINAGKARVNFGQMLDEVYYKGEQFIIERAGKPRAAVVPLSVLEGWQKHTASAQKSIRKKSKRNG
jgi:prevent-host-death family protein